MTDSSRRRNPAPRPALPRRTRTEPPGTAPLDAVPPPPSATGRDVIIPSVPKREAAAPGATPGTPPDKEPPRKGKGKAKGNGRPAPMPSLADLMPPTRPKTQAEPPSAPPAAPPASAPTPVPPVPAPRPAPPRPVAPPTPVPRPPKKAKGGHDKDREKTVELAVPLTKGLRKRLKGKAAEHGMKPEQAVAELVRIWVDG